MDSLKLVDRKELPPGSSFVLEDGSNIIVLNGSGFAAECEFCYFLNKSECAGYECVAAYRGDSTDVYFKKI